MPNIQVLDITGKKTGEIELLDAVFGIEVNRALIHSAVVMYLANQRQGTQSALTRAEVAGGGRKPWRQKGTGRARQGSTRAPQWTHGGIAFAPKPRDYRLAMNKKQKRLAMKSALSMKVAEGNFTVVDKYGFEEIKTKKAVSMLSALGLTGKTLILTADVEKNLVLSARNIPGVKVSTASTTCVYDLVKYDNVIASSDAVARIVEVFA